MVLLARRLLVHRTCTTAVSTTHAPRRRFAQVGRLAGGVSLVSVGIMGGMSWWQTTSSLHPTHAEVPKYVFGSRKAIHEISRRLSKLRLLQIFWTLLPLIFLYPLVLLHCLDPKRYWDSCTSQLEKCGPCFVKLAQWLATRRDIFAPEFCEALGRLHEEVHATWSEGIDSGEVARELQKRGVHFKALDKCAVASGSIGEVFFGELEDGTEVAVKCLRPNIRALMEADLAWLLWLGNWADRQDTLKRFSFKRVAEDFCEQVWMQMDFEIEADHLDHFHRTFADSSGSVSFPTALYTAPEVLVLTREYGHNLARVFRDASEHTVTEVSRSRALEEAGTRISERDLYDEKVQEQLSRARDLQRALGVTPQVGRHIASETLSLFFRMIFRDAFIHGDLHPGNIILHLHSDDKESSTNVRKSSSLMEQLRQALWGQPPFECVIIDAGLAIPLPPRKVHALRSMGLAIMYADYDRAARIIFNESPDSSQCKSPDLFIKGLASIFKGTRVDVQQAGYLQISDACLGALRLVNQHKVGMDTELTWVLLSLLSVEGAARQFDPLVDATAAASKHMLSLRFLVDEFMDGASRESCKNMLMQISLEAAGFDYWQYRNFGRLVRALPAGTPTPMPSS